MNNPTEPSLTVVRSPSASEIILSRTNNDFIQDVIEQAIPADVWETLEAAAVENRFCALSVSREKQAIRTHIMTAVHAFWDNARDLERQGYTISGLKLHIQFKSLVAQTEMNCEIATTATERKMDVVLTDITDAEATIEETRTNFRPDDLPLIIEAVRIGNIPSNLPRIAVTKIREELEKNPNWTGEDIEQMHTVSSTLDLYQLNIKPTLFFESAPAQIDDSTKAAPALLDTNETNSASQATTTLEEAAPAFRKTMSSHREIKQGLFMHGIHTKYKTISHNPADIQSGLQSLSMNGSGNNA